jgi:hypothetical protein
MLALLHRDLLQQLPVCLSAGKSHHFTDKHVHPLVVNDRALGFRHWNRRPWDGCGRRRRHGRSESGGHKNEDSTEGERVTHGLSDWGLS